MVAGGIALTDFRSCEHVRPFLLRRAITLQRTRTPQTGFVPGENDSDLCLFSFFVLALGIRVFLICHPPKL
jgi:hypothetical protein